MVRRIAHHFFVQWGDREIPCMLRGRLKKERQQVMIGDRVRLEGLDEEPDDDEGAGGAQAAIAEVLPRRNALTRPPLANVDQILVVMAGDRPPFNSNLLDRLLVLASVHGIPVAICLNKRELVDPAERDRLLAPYRALGYRVATTSAKGGEVEELLPHLGARVTVLAGPSGSGKSSLLNALHPGLSLRSGEVSAKDLRGRHTTTYASLYRIPVAEGQWAMIADTPGFSFLEFEPIAPEDLGWHFPEMAPWIPSCPLSKCLHREEPHCAVKASAAMVPGRYESYLAFLDELVALTSRLSTTGKAEAAVKRKVGAAGSEQRLVKIGAQDREGSRRLHRQRLDDLVDEEAEGVPDPDLEGDN